MKILKVNKQKNKMLFYCSKIQQKNIFIEFHLSVILYGLIKRKIHPTLIYYVIFLNKCL